MKKLIFTQLITFLILVSCKKDEIETPGSNSSSVGDLKVRISDESRQPLQGATIKMESFSGVTDSNGECEFKALPVKEYKVSVSKQNYATNYQKIGVVRGKTTMLEVTLIAGDVFGQLQMIKHKGILGNDDQRVQDSVYVLFNKPVSVEKIQYDWKSCQPEPPVNFSQTDNNMGIKFNFGCAELGGRYPFSITVKDKDGVSLTKNIEVPFYHSKLDIEGYVTDILLINEDKEMLISVSNPDRIVRYSIESNTIVESYDMSSVMAPIKLSYNPYNDKVYILGNTNPNAENRYSYMNSPNVYALNYHTGEISQAFTVVPDEKDYSTSPANIPYDIGFTKTGLGIILLRSNGSSALRWKIIDSSQDDKIYIYPHYDNSTITEYTDFNKVYVNFDQSRLFLTQPYGSVDYGIFDEKTEKISILRPSSVSRSNTVTPHRKADKFYVRQLYDQFIMDSNGNRSKSFYLDSRHGGNADFSYRSNESNIIYICEAESIGNASNNFKVLDYNTLTILKSCEVIDGLQEFSTTVNGKYGVAYRRNSLDVSSSIYTFLTDTFYGHTH